MKGLKESVASANEELERMEKNRELAIGLSRALIRRTKNAIHDIHIGEDNSRIIDILRKDMDNILSSLDDATLRSSPVRDAMMEYSEAIIFTAVYNKEKITSHTELKVDASSWALGLSDVVGELRRLVLSYLVKDDYENAEYFFQCMDSITEEVMMFDIADSVSSIRKKQDAVRAIMERTRSDYSNAVIMKR